MCLSGLEFHVRVSLRLFLVPVAGWPAAVCLMWWEEGRGREGLSAVLSWGKTEEGTNEFSDSRRP